MISPNYSTDHVYYYFTGFDMNEVNNYPDEIIREDFEKAYHILEVEEMVKAIEKEREIKRLERLYQIDRIAKEAKDKQISLASIVKFFSLYNINAKEQYIFWCAYQGLNWG